MDMTDATDHSRTGKMTTPPVDPDTAPVRGRVVVIDADQAHLATIRALLETDGYLCETHVSARDYQKWIRADAEMLPEPEMPADVELVNVDEMWHVLKKSAKNLGSSERLILLSGECFPGCSNVVMMQPSKGFSTKSA